METCDIKTNTEKLLSFVSGKFQKDELNNDSLVQLIESAGAYLNLRTIADYSKEHKMSYNGVKHHRQIVELFGIKFVLDND